MKWVRGLAHLNSLQNRIAQWDAGGHVWAELVLDKSEKHVDSILRIDAPPPLAEMSLLLGDAVHNMRSALDALVWELCHLDGKIAAKPTLVKFPAARTKAEWRTTAGHLRTMPVPFLDRVHAFQPYLADVPNSTLIGLLADMSNQDKHRGMIAASAEASSLALEFSINQDDLGQSTPEGAIDGISFTPAGDNFRDLTDQNPYFGINTSARISLTRERVPVQIGYTIGVEGVSYDLAAVIVALTSMHTTLYQLCGLADMPSSAELQSGERPAGDA